MSLELREGDLVAISLPPGPPFIDVLRAAWVAGAAVLPVDDRLTSTEADALLRHARPRLVVSGDGVHQLDEAVASHPDVALVVATSGTTGEPKLVELTRAGVQAALRASNARLGAGDDDPWLSCLPLAHIGGLLVAMRSVVLGTPVAVRPGLEPGDLSAVCFTSMVPTMLHRLMETGAGLSGLSKVLVGGAALDPDLQRRAGDRVVSTYGMTETCGGCVYDGVALDGVGVRVADGEIQLRSASMLRGYRLGGVPALTRDGWLRTGDAGVLVGGALRVSGRLDDAIVTGGEKVWPLEVEVALRTHPAVVEVAVAGRADAEWGQRVVAWVVAREPVSLEALRDHAARTLARYKLPKQLVVVDALPRTSLGKVRRSAL